MKRNPEDKYWTTENDMIIEDDATQEQMLFFIDRKNRIVIRSLLEEDIKTFVCNAKITGKMRRQKLKILYEEIPKSNSQYYFFCIERIIGEEDKKIADSIYGLPRKPIGLAGRSDEEITLTGKIPSEIAAVLYEKDNLVAGYVCDMLEKLAKFFKCSEQVVAFLK